MCISLTELNELKNVSSPDFTILWQCNAIQTNPPLWFILGLRDQEVVYWQYQYKNKKMFAIPI